MPAGDAVLIVELDDRIDAAVNARAIATADTLRAAAIPGVRDVVPAFRSVAVYFEPLRTDQRRLEAETRRAASDARHLAETSPSQSTVEIPVCYEPELGPDLDAVASRAQLDRDTVIHLHAGRTYRVFMLGFVPGFAYLGSLDPRIAVPRRQTPRAAVAAGSVGIAGEQTGVYPCRTPGGWQIIGRTPIAMFSASRPESSLLRAGDHVRFVPIDRAEFDRLAGAMRDAA